MIEIDKSSSNDFNKSPQQARRSGKWERVEQRVGNIPPCQRSLHAAACWKDNMLVFGGYDGHVRLNDLHCYNFTTNRWSILNSYQAPSPRDRHSAVIYEHYLVIFGGFDGVSRVDDLHMFDLERNQWSSVEDFHGTPPSARHSHSAVRWRDSLFIFGGYDGSYRSDFHEFNFAQSRWTQIHSQGDVPRARYRGTCVVYENIMILHGGHDGGRHLQDTHIFDFLTKTWHVLETTGPVPSPRDSHVAVIYNKSMFIYGGSTGSAMGDFHQLKIADRCWQTVEVLVNPSRSHELDSSVSGQIPSMHASGLSSGSSSTASSLHADMNPYYTQSSTAHMSQSVMYGLAPNSARSQSNQPGPVGSEMIVSDPQFVNNETQLISSANNTSLFPSTRVTPSQPFFSSPGRGSDSSTGLTTQPLASTSTFYYNSASTSAGGGSAPVRAGSRFCHVGVIYDDSLFVFGGYDGQTRLNDFLRFRFESGEEDLPPSTLLADLRLLVDNELLSDVTFIVDGIPVRAHKVLCLRCPYFRNLLTGEYMESRENEIIIPDVRHGVFLQFLQFLYSDHVDVSMESAMELFQTADRFGLERLKKITENVMLQALSIDTAGQILLAAEMHHAGTLRERCMNFIINNFDDVSKTVGFEDMARSDVELLFEILRSR